MWSGDETRLDSVITKNLQNENLNSTHMFEFARCFKGANQGRSYRFRFSDQVQARNIFES